MAVFLIPTVAYFFCYNNKVTKIIVVASTLIIMATLFSFQNNHGGRFTDYDAYHALWDFVRGGGNNPYYIGYETDYGFMWIVWIVSRFTKSFEIFCFIIFLLSLLFILFGYHKLSKVFKTDISLFVPIVYTIYPFIYDLIQIRFFLAYSIVFCAFCILISSNEGLKGRLLYTCLILIATAIHSATAVYLIFAFVTGGKNWRTFRKILPFFIVIFFFLRNRIVSFPIIGEFFGGKEQYLVASKGSSAMSAIFIGGSLLFYVFVTKYILEQFLKYHPEIIGFNADLIININTAMLVILPFLFQNLDVERMFRPVYLLDWIIIFSGLKFFKSNIIKLGIIAPILVIQVIHFVRLNGLIEQALNNVLYVLF